MTDPNDDGVSAAEDELRRFRLKVLKSVTVTERYEEAVDVARMSAHQNPYFSSTLRCLAAAHACLGQLEEAREAAEHLLRIEPNFTISDWDRRSRWKHPAKINYIAGMRLAGLPQ